MPNNNHSNFFNLLFQTIGLQTPEGRWFFFILVSFFVFFAPYNLLANLSIWQHLGINSPSIGLTRTYQQLLHLNFGQAWNHGNRLIFPVIIIGGDILLKDLRQIIKKRSAKQPA